MVGGGSGGEPEYQPSGRNGVPSAQAVAERDGARPVMAPDIMPPDVMTAGLENELSDARTPEFVPPPPPRSNNLPSIDDGKRSCDKKLKVAR